jgi:hypothetical protein
MHSPSGAPSQVASALSTFESNISKNSGHTSRDFLSIIASSPIRRPPYQRTLSLTRTAKEIEYDYEQIINDDFKTNPLISPQKFHMRTDGAAPRPGLPSLSLFDDNDGTDSTPEHGVVSKDEEATFCELDDIDDEESIAESYQEPDVAAGVAVKDSVEDISEVSDESYREPAAPWDDDATVRDAMKEEASCETSQGTNVTEAESCESDGESCARVSILPSFEEQARMLRVRDRKPVVSVSPIKLKDRMRAFQHDMSLNAL